MAIIGISSIHLLRSFIALGQAPGAGEHSAVLAPVQLDHVMWQSIIHGLFIVSAIGIAYVDRMGNAGHNDTH